MPLLAGDHVTDDAGTGFVHTAPGHGREDFEVWIANRARPAKPRHQSGDSLYRRRKRRLHRGGTRLTGKRVINDKGEKGDANEAVIKALTDTGMHHCARPAQASVPAQLAIEEADHFPQYPAVVHRDG